MAKGTLSTDDAFMWNCPGCKDTHGVPTSGEIAWGFNGSLNEPTLTPSILLYSHKNSPPFKDQPRCHSLIINGKIHFCNDSEHELAGQIVDMPEWE